jgi:HEAT repeat protein
LTYGKQLADYLRAYPDTAMELSRLLRTNLYSSEVTMTVIAALEQAGHLPAQKALLELIADPRAEAHIQIAQATVSTGGILHPDPLLTEGLWQRVEMRATEHDTALLALGRLSSALDANGDTAAAGTIRTRLTQLLQQAEPGNFDQIYALLGLGNASNDEVYPIIAPYLEAEDSRVRGAAVQALRTFHDTASYQALLEVSTQDAEDRVRRQAFESLTIRSTKQSPDPDTITTIAQHLPAESSSQVRTEMIQFLGQHKNANPEALNALQSQLRQETDREMLKTIYRALYQATK